MTATAVRITPTRGPRGHPAGRLERLPAARYTFTLPSATIYSSVRASAYGKSMSGYGKGYIGHPQLLERQPRRLQVHRLLDRLVRQQRRGLGPRHERPQGPAVGVRRQRQLRRRELSQGEAHLQVRGAQVLISRVPSPALISRWVARPSADCHAGRVATVPYPRHNQCAARPLEGGTRVRMIVRRNRLLGAVLGTAILVTGAAPAAVLAGRGGNHAIAPGSASSDRADRGDRDRLAVQYARFYPRKDDYRDTNLISGETLVPATVTIRIYTSGGTRIKSFLLGPRRVPTRWSGTGARRTARCSPRAPTRSSSSSPPRAPPRPRSTRSSCRTRRSPGTSAPRPATQTPARSSSRATAR